MLEPGESSSPVSKSPPKSSSFAKSPKKGSASTNREKAAFLFGEETNDILQDTNQRLSKSKDSDAGFNMGTIKNSQNEI